MQLNGPDELRLQQLQQLQRLRVLDAERAAARALQLAKAVGWLWAAAGCCCSIYRNNLQRRARHRLLLCDRPAIPCALARRVTNRPRGPLSVRLKLLYFLARVTTALERVGKENVSERMLCEKTLSQKKHGSAYFGIVGDRRKFPLDY